MNRVESGVGEVLNLRVGERVRVKSRQDILATLDRDGMLDRLPFMPGMLQYCGREVTVFKRADKTCDTIEKSAGRRMMHAVHLEDSRCDGAAHGGCEAQCLMFWKEAWLERIVGRETSPATMGAGSLRSTRSAAPLTEAQLLATTIRTPVEGSEDGDVYRCQATELRNATTALSSSIRACWRSVMSTKVMTAPRTSAPSRIG